VGKELKRERRLFALMLLISSSGAVALLAIDGRVEILVVPYMVAVQLVFRALGRIDFDVGRVAMAVRLRRAMTAGEIVMHYQPKLSLTTGELVGVEALARWQHPRRGLLAPAEWLPAAELPWLERRFMRYTLDAALGQARRWRAEDRLDVVVCVNITPSCLGDRRFPRELREAMIRSHTTSSQVQIELTEVALELSPIAIGVADQLNAMGVALALDDFGVGHSSMDRLVQLPISELKIDRRFVMRQTTSPRDAAVVRGAINLARALGLSVTAEGVETERDVQSLRRQQCETAQGYFFSPALPADEMVAWIRNRPALADPPHVIRRPVDRRSVVRRRGDERTLV